MPRYSISEESKADLTNKTLSEIYSSTKSIVRAEDGEYPNFDFSDLDHVFNVACKDRRLFVSFNLETPSVKNYIKRWITSYCHAIQNPQSKRCASPKKNYSDPIVKRIVQKAKDLSEVDVSGQEKAHTSFMSAENVLGNLLEEFIAKKIRPYGWIWCAGGVLKSVDFCTIDGALLQIKNKNNSENSSSSRVREGTGIKRWYRLSTSGGGGVIKPIYHWEKLNLIVNSQVAKQVDGDERCNITEEDFEDYITDVVTKNKAIITDE